MSLWGNFIKPQICNLCLMLLPLLLITPIDLDIKQNIIRLKGIYRIGPHNKDVISVIFGSLLGDAHAERRLKGLGTRIGFYQEDVHVEYILYLHKFLSDLGYCNPKVPESTKRLGFKGKIRKIVRFSTWTYTSFNWIHDMWYENNIKRVPESIGKYLTPLALAIWIMDDGAKVGKGLKFCTNSFSYNECLILIKALNDNFNIKSSVQSAGTKDQYIIYIWKESMDDLRKIVSPYIIPEMKYKLY
uniref:Intronic ORF 2 at intron 1 of cob n=1 Tax=Moniliophthora roreri (strain MCA 2997) TaxID=1381753 RepID=F2WVM1_MONRO|nr:intronic ORF 2 at intron 1 of cob [Moniliophthora roreri]ADO51580.1 intronic ORF 2 at intron 1 of cob [Moniliophthora roreri]